MAFSTFRFPTCLLFVKTVRFHSAFRLALAAALIGAAVGDAAPVREGRPRGEDAEAARPAVDWPDFVEQFPAMASDGTGDVWLAVLERPLPEKRIRIDRIHDGTQETVGYFQPDGMTGLDAPALAGLDAGCVAVFAFEKDDQWRVACAFLDAKDSGALSCVEIPCEGNANIASAVAAVDGKALVLWESNAGAARGIYACWVDPNSGAGAIQRLSSGEANSYNPAVAALPDGGAFAAWDSVRDESADIYGARLRAGKWAPERRITSDPRIERHPYLAARGADVWMAWQAQRYAGMGSNNMHDQIIPIARIAEEGPDAVPVGLFEQVSPAESYLLRPRIAFDAQGRLWATANRGGQGERAGWTAVAWCYDGAKWTEERLLDGQYGRWQPIPPAFSPANGALAAVQFDDLPAGYVERGIRPDWHSAVKVVPLTGGSDNAEAFRVEPFRMPPGNFSLPNAMAATDAELPRQRWERPGGELVLYWGDLHCHTDLSICNRLSNQPGHDSFATLRDIERLDFAALTDHGYHHDNPQWSYNGEQTRNNNDPGRFVTFLGEEWTSSVGGGSGGYGHHNLIFLNPYYDTFYDAYDGDITPAEVWNEITADGEEFICIPHELADWPGEGKSGNPPTDWNYVDEWFQPVAEIFQNRGSYEYLGAPRQARRATPFAGHFLQDAWAQGIIIGTIASPDHAGGRGKAGVWAKELTREALFEGLRARHTFGTSGRKMALRFSAGDFMMGDKVPRTEGPIEFETQGTASRPVKEVVIFRNNKIVFSAAPNEKEFDLSWIDDNPPDEAALWYYARFMTDDDEIAWSSPMWFLKEAGNKEAKNIE